MGSNYGGMTKRLWTSSTRWTQPKEWTLTGQWETSPCPRKVITKQDKLGCLNCLVSKTLGKSYPILQSILSFFPNFVAFKLLYSLFALCSIASKGKNKFIEVACVARKGKATIDASAPLPKRACQAKDVILPPSPPPPPPPLTTNEQTTTLLESSFRGALSLPSN